MINLLEKNFFGTGEVKEFEFNQIRSTVSAYLYEVKQNDGNIHFEVFKRKNAPMCIDFENRIYSETDFKEIYPKSNDFGVWAWTFKSYFKSLELLNILENGEIL